jgi:hypothetical protein
MVIKLRMVRWARHAARIGEIRTAYRILVGKPGRKKSLGRPRRRWTNNCKSDLKGIIYEVVDWIHLAEDRDQWQTLEYTVMNIQVL